MYECSGRTRGDDGYVREQDGFGYTSGDDCSDIDDISFETHKFLQNDGFYLLSQPVEPWRTEAMINGEGDLQLTVHHALPDGEDFRFMFSIDPYFRPTLCTTDAEGNPKVEYLDGSDWVDRWSENEEGYKYLECWCTNSIKRHRRLLVLDYRYVLRVWARQVLG